MLNFLLHEYVNFSQNSQVLLTHTMGFINHSVYLYADFLLLNQKKTAESV